MHLALFYRGDEDYLDGVMSFVEPALSAGEPVAAAVPPARGELLSEQLGGEEIEILDMFELGRNPARIIPAVEKMIASHEGTRLHYVGEPIWPGRTEEEVREAVKHEALINLAWPGAPIRVLCPYDTEALDSAVLADAERTHPRVIRDGEALDSAAYHGPAVPAGCDQQLLAPPPEAQSMMFGVQDLFRIRRLVSERAAAAGMSRDRAADLVLAVDELATNAIRHGSGGGIVHVWNKPGRMVCEVRDRGRIRDPLAGRRAPVPGVPGGLGLWTVNQLCDLVEVRTGDAGTTVRVHAVLN